MIQHKLTIYQSYKDSGIQWLGQIPAHWSVDRAKSMFRKMSRPVSETDEIVTVFRDGQVTLRKNRRTSGFTNAILETGYQGSKKVDLVIHAMDGFAGAIGVSDSDGKSSPVYSVYLPADPKRIYNPYYGYLIRQMAVSGFIASLGKGIRERSSEFRHKEFAPLSLPIPPYDEQKAIVGYLNTKTVIIDRKIDLLTQKTQKYIGLRKSLINETILRGLNKNVPLKDSGLKWAGKIPTHWEIERAKALFKRMSRGVSETDGIITAFRDGQVTLREKRRTDGFTNAIFEHGYQGIRVGDLVIHAMDGFAGAIGVSDSNGKSSPVYSAYTPIDPERVQTPYYGLLVREMALCGFVASLGKGIRERSSEFRHKEFAPLELIVPPFEEQKAIADYLAVKTAHIDQIVKTIKAEIEKLEELRKTLIYNVISGKIKVYQA
jgi:type I restriction enzyme, S subunit